MLAKHPAGKSPEKRWSRLSDGELLRERFCDLRLSLRNSLITPDIADLYQALDRRGIRFRPHVWLSTEWFSPDGIPGIAVPFYAAHPRLLRLERHMKGEAEGSNRRARRQLLRHEAGHAMDTAFGLRRRADWRAVFGRSSRPYPRCYSVRPASRRFVQHLGRWYAQSHPTEDFAETFAVWLQPRARWRRDYADWPALRKLEFVDELMAEVAGRRPSGIDRSTAAALKDNRRRLGEYYRRSHGPADISERRYDACLHGAFAPPDTDRAAPLASAFLRSIQKDLHRSLIRRTGAEPYLISHVMDTLRRRTRELDLTLACNKREARQRAISLHEAVIHDVLRRNREYYML